MRCVADADAGGQYVSGAVCKAFACMSLVLTPGVWCYARSLQQRAEAQALLQVTWLCMYCMLLRPSVQSWGADSIFRSDCLAPGGQVTCELVCHVSLSAPKRDSRPALRRRFRDQGFARCSHPIMSRPSHVRVVSDHVLASAYPRKRVGSRFVLASLLRQTMARSMLTRECVDGVWGAGRRRTEQRTWR
eukprot:434076-Rhodomonas_salina.1